MFKITEIDSKKNNNSNKNSPSESSVSSEDQEIIRILGLVNDVKIREDKLDNQLSNFKEEDFISPVNVPDNTGNAPGAPKREKGKRNRTSLLSRQPVGLMSNESSTMPGPLNMQTMSSLSDNSYEYDSEDDDLDQIIQDQDLLIDGYLEYYKNNPDGYLLYDENDKEKMYATVTMLIQKLLSDMIRLLADNLDTKYEERIRNGLNNIINKIKTQKKTTGLENLQRDLNLYLDRLKIIKINKELTLQDEEAEKQKTKKTRYTGGKTKKSKKGKNKKGKKKKQTKTKKKVLKKRKY